MKARHIALGAALLVAAGFALFGDKTPAPAVAEAVVRAPPARPVAPVRPAAAQPAERTIVPLVPRAELIADGADPIGQGDTVFMSQNWMPPPPKPVPPPPPPPPPPPSAPPLPFTYVGKSSSDGVLEVFLSRGDKTYIVRKNTVVDGMYRIDAIAPPTLTLTYLPLNQSQRLNIGVSD